ncbi:uncharacterized protein LOC107016483 [Solanum pennellii]|uniref:Uncharacterized protein LOC107016483 n=1 Tax=Solanum pennellii TaxID=28526 RepID=A0ABM1GKQ8_SOLPN|nr:uncharacterized protein LOC107016483 [Solanum pennellii]
MKSSSELSWVHSIIDISGGGLSMTPGSSSLGTTSHEESTNKKHFGIPYTFADSISREEYVPRWVSIGPLYYGKSRYAGMENFKRKAVRELLLLNNNCSSDEELASVEKVYRSVEQDLRSARDLYGRNKISDSEWCQMMFRDGCFIIYFIISTGKRSWLMNRDRDLVWRDILLLTNQLPFQLIEVLARAFKCKEFTDFQLPIPPVLDNYIHKGFLYRPPNPVHLLQYYIDLWTYVLFKYDKGEAEDHQPFSVTDLKKVGIRCSSAISDHRKDIHLKSSILSGKLFLPKLIINESTMTLLKNIVAYEKFYRYEDTFFTISSYLNFMSMLINGEEDVKELQARGVIQINLKFSDDQVINFMRDITTHHVYNPQAFKYVKRQISTYCKSKNLFPLRVGYAEFKQRYFSGPWSFLVFLAIIFTVSMTVIQTVFTGIQTYKKN